MHYPVRLLFISYHNAARSQVAEALLRRMGGGDFQVNSAGIEPKPFEPLVIEVMAKMGIDISGQISMSIDQYMGEEFDYIISLCDKSEPYIAEFPGDHEYIHWRFPDPAEFQGSDHNKRQLLRRLFLELNGRIRLWVEREHIKLQQERITEFGRYARQLG